MQCFEVYALKQEKRLTLIVLLLRHMEFVVSNVLTGKLMVTGPDLSGGGAVKENPDLLSKKI